MKTLRYETALLVMGLSAFALGATATKTATKTAVPAKQAVTATSTKPVVTPTAKIVTTASVKTTAKKTSPVTIDGGKEPRAGYGWSATFELKAGQTLHVYVEDAKGVRTSESSFVLAPRHKAMQGRVSIGGVPK